MVNLEVVDIHDYMVNLEVVDIHDYRIYSNSSRGYY